MKAAAASRWWSTVLLVLAMLSTISLALADVPVALPAAITAAPVMTSGLAPMPGGAPIPEAWLPPGSDAQDHDPSEGIFPPQKLTLRFNHKLHIKNLGATCDTCHGAAIKSDSVNDSLIPPPTICDSCHTTDHTNLAKVEAGDGKEGQCVFCHVGYRPEDGNRVAKLELPRANMNFTHKKHIARSIHCAQCHGEVGELELATRTQLPRMRGCFTCHQGTDSAAQGQAKSACTTCHLRPLGEGPPHTIAETQRNAGSEIRTSFASGNLEPPRWLHDSEHTPDWMQRHKMVAAADSQYCGNCHKSDFCTDCHDGRVRPRDIHPGDYLSMHPIEARMATQRCTSCHQEQSFCLTCHLRMGVAQSSPEGVRESGRFHPPKVIWSDAPRQPGHHAFEAERNLNACVSCHTERDCVSCHGAQGVGGGFNPHRGSFMSTCRTQFRRNPRPCFVCHEPGDAQLAACGR